MKNIESLKNYVDNVTEEEFMILATKIYMITDFICDDCREHFTSLQKYLDTMGIEYTVNPQIVRGLDYYTRTVFEFISKYEKTEGLVVCGGGRYDGLIHDGVNANSDGTFSKNTTVTTTGNKVGATIKASNTTKNTTSNK